MFFIAFYIVTTMDKIKFSNGITTILMNDFTNIITYFDTFYLASHVGLSICRLIFFDMLSIVNFLLSGQYQIL